MEILDTKERLEALSTRKFSFIMFVLLKLIFTVLVANNCFFYYYFNLFPVLPSFQ